MKRLAGPALVLALLGLLSTMPSSAQERRRRAAPAPPEGVKLLRDLVYGQGGGRDLRLDLYLPEKVEGSLPVIVWVHGGGWRGGSKARTRAAPMATRGYAVASVEYRLSAEATFPAQIHDVKAAVRWLRANAKKYRLDPKRFGAWGSSAGGHLVALLGTSGGVEALEGAGGSPDHSSRVQAVCDWFGPADLTREGVGGRMESPNNPVALLLGGPPSEKKELAALASPVTHVTEDDPPFLIMHGDQDRTVPIQQSEVLHTALGKAGVSSALHVEKGAGHGLRGRDVAEIVNAFFDRHLLGRKSTPSPGALIFRSFPSKALGAEESYALYLPPGYEQEPERRYPVVYWLHGLGGSPRGAAGFVRRIDEAIRAGKTPPMIVVGVNGHKSSMYCDAKDGSRPVETVIVKELIPHIDATYRTWANREGRAIEGFSMGGFGAAHLGFKYPDLFGAVSIMSGAIQDRKPIGRRRGPIFREVYGGDAEYFAAQGPWRLVEENAEQIRGRTHVRIAVGARDKLLAANERFHELLGRLRIVHSFVVARDAPHSHEALYRELGGLTPRFYRNAFRVGSKAR